MIGSFIIRNSVFFSLMLALHGGSFVSAQTDSSGAPILIRGVEVGAILNRLGAKMEKGVSTIQIREYQGHFGRIDLDGDGRHSKDEFIEKGRYLNPQSRRGIFYAADRDRDGFVTEAEYVLNRIITDEAKAIVQNMDDDKDGSVERTEFVGHATERLSDGGLAAEVFSAFDSDGNDWIVVPEYLRVWGLWARSSGQSANQRLADQLNNEGDLESLPPRPFLNRRPVQGLGRGGPPGGFSIERLFRFDQNGDDQVSKAELPEFLRERVLNRIDANKDGIIDRTEAELIEKQAP